MIDFAGFEELSHLLPGGVSRDEVREKWISSPFVQRFERAEITPDVFALGVVEELELDLGPDEFIDAFVDWARGPYPGARSLLGVLQKEARLACLSNSNELRIVIIGAEFDWERGTERRSEAPLSGLVAT